MRFAGKHLRLPIGIVSILLFAGPLVAPSLATDHSTANHASYSVAWLPATFENPKGEDYEPGYETSVTAYRKAGQIRVQVLTTDGHQDVHFDVPARAVNENTLSFEFSNDGAFNSGKGTLKKTKTGAIIDMKVTHRSSDAIAGMFLRLYPDQEELERVKKQARK